MSRSRRASGWVLAQVMQTGSSRRWMELYRSPPIGGGIGAGDQVDLLPHMIQHLQEGRDGILIGHHLQPDAGEPLRRPGPQLQPGVGRVHQRYPHPDHRLLRPLQQISLLEDRIGVKLFQRTHQGAALTGAGIVLVIVILGSLVMSGHIYVPEAGEIIMDIAGAKGKTVITKESA